MATNYGSDSYCVTDVGLTDVQVKNPAILIGQRLARRFQTPRGGLAAFGGPADFGWDLRQYVMKKMDVAARSTAQQQVENECLKDEQVLTVSVDMSVDASGTVNIVIKGVTSAGLFTLTGNVSQFSAPEFFVQ
jgi:hypothetical protein